MQMDDSTTSADSAMIDSQMRKQLPAWLREGLEKMEREKVKQQQTEQEDLDGSSTGTSEKGRIPKWRLEETEGVIILIKACN